MHCSRLDFGWKQVFDVFGYNNVYKLTIGKLGTFCYCGHIFRRWRVKESEEHRHHRHGPGGDSGRLRRSFGGAAAVFHILVATNFSGGIKTCIGPTCWLSSPIVLQVSPSYHKHYFILFLVIKQVYSFHFAFVCLMFSGDILLTERPTFNISTCFSLVSTLFINNHRWLSVFSCHLTAL